MVRTRVGYAGGTKKNPTYHDLGDHSETIQMDYDPGYGTLVELQEDLPGFGLSPQAEKRLTTVVSKRKGRSGCRL